MSCTTQGVQEWGKSLHLHVLSENVTPGLTKIKAISEFIVGIDIYEQSPIMPCLKVVTSLNSAHS